ncbi:hypothetical protein XYCOK13_24000 [Xylanibacillus composti]|uniref:Carrier domain-containing protein n=1 Tax=Xylanibacillus composti TaxID=1572762 RepID=A0A8J4M3J7_9BACL|nr:condensation domain-containing protein [Xylanibacillus composti]GIQ69576.1 hypothetical protein XYCOK13_24000 [Xylanibacillus composti]
MGGDIDIFNEYGPTEATVGCMTHLYDRDKDKRVSVPIGVPADNMQIYVLDAHLNPVPANTIGELYIAGEGLARGYWNRDQLNEERFLPNPFVPGARMYKTGDLAKFLDNGLIEYGGRNDHQVKLHGYRIELGEIEACLLSHPAVNDALVLDWTTESGGKFLCAYVVVSSDVSTSDLRLYVEQRLPFHMVPAALMELDAIPLNRNGKVDRDALPAPATGGTAGDAEIETLTEREITFLDQVKAVLHVEHAGLQDNFYHLGGDSIKAIQLSAKLRSAGFALKVREILDHPVLAHMLAQTTDDQIPVLPAREEQWTGPVGEWPIIAWFWEQPLSNPAYYNQSVLLKLHEDIAAEVVEEVLQTVIERYDAFRIRIDMNTRALYYDNSPAKIKVGIFSLRHLQANEQQAEMERMGAMLKSGFAAEPGMLFRACKFDLGQNGSRLLLTAHHLIMDGVSWRILLDDFTELYGARMKKRQANLPAPTHSLRAWAHHLRSHVDAFKQDFEYWRTEAAHSRGVEPELRLGEDTVASSETLTFRLHRSESEQFLRAAHRAYRTEPQDLLCTALALTLFESFRVEKTVIELEGHGREPLNDSIDVSRTMGWFTSLYPVQLAQTGGSLDAAIKTTKEKLRQVPRKGLGYGIWRYLAKAQHPMGEHKPIRLNYLGELDTTMNNSLFALSAETTGPESDPDNPLTALIEFNAWIANGCLQVHATYSRNRMYTTTMTSLMELLDKKLKAILHHCCTKGDSEFTPSDFHTAKLSQDELDGLLL